MERLCPWRQINRPLIPNHLIKINISHKNVTPFIAKISRAVARIFTPNQSVYLFFRNFLFDHFMTTVSSIVIWPLPSTRCRFRELVYPQNLVYVSISNQAQSLLRNNNSDYQLLCDSCQSKTSTKLSLTVSTSLESLNQNFISLRIRIFENTTMWKVHGVPEWKRWPIILIFECSRKHLFTIII